MINADGSGLRRITVSPSSADRSTDGNPHWSPDGRWIAFTHDTGKRAQIVIVRGDGSGRRVLGETTGDGGFDWSDPWSPDGRELAWAGCGGLCVFNLAGSKRSSIPLDVYDGWGFSWSPDGKRLAATEGYDDRLFVVGVDGRVQTLLARSGQWPAWSPDGRAVAFIVDNRSGKKLEIVPSAGGGARVLDRQAAGRAEWSRDGRSLLYPAWSGSVRTGTVVRTLDLTTGRAVDVVDLTTGRAVDVDDTAGAARWAPDGSAVAFTRQRFTPGLALGDFASDVWIAGRGGAGLRELTFAFPTGVSYTDLDWTAGRVPVAPSHPASPLSLTATADLEVGDWLSGIDRAASPDSVAYQTDTLCDPDGGTQSASVNVWTPPAAVTTTTSPCLELPDDSFGVAGNLVGWEQENNPVDGRLKVGVAHAGSSDAQLAGWASEQESPDIGWRSDFGPVIGGGSLLVFNSYDHGGTQLWRIVDSTSGGPHAVPVPLPADAVGALDADAGRIVVLASSGGLIVLEADGTVVSRLPFLHESAQADSYTVELLAGRVAIGGDLVGTLTGTTLSTYSAGTGAVRQQYQLAHAAGNPRLLTIGEGYAVYTSGVEVHLLRLADSLDRVLDLPGQAGDDGAVLTAEVLFLSYNRAYTQKTARVLFVPLANLP